MRFVSLFAGVGGFDLGFELAGWECVGQVEIDKHCQTVLKRHWPDVPLHDDVTTAKEWADECGLVGNVDVVCGGFPCQPFSVAGKRLGRDDIRGNLFWNALDFTTHVGAETIILENVPGLLTADEGRTFGEILVSLADAGFDHIEWRVVDSQAFGVPQRRKRVFIVGSARDFGGRAVLLEPEGLRWHPPQGVASWQASARGVAGGVDGGSGLAERERDLSDPANGLLHEGHDQLNDRGTGLQVRHRSGGGPVTGTLSPGAHPGGFNGQDAYNNLLVVVSE